MFEDQVTVLCRFGPARAEAFSPWVLRGVHWAGADGRRPSPGAGRRRAEGLLVVPYAAAGGYVSPAAWERLSPEAVSYTHLQRQADAAGQQQIAHEHAAQGHAFHSLFHLYPIPQTVSMGEGPAGASFARMFFTCSVTADSSAVPS